MLSPPCFWPYTALESDSSVLVSCCLWFPSTQNPWVWADFKETLVIYCDTPPSLDPSVPCPLVWLSLTMNWCCGSLALTQSSTLSHCSGLWPVAPLGEWHLCWTTALWSCLSEIFRPTQHSFQQKLRDESWSVFLPVLGKSFALKLCCT